jgi:hypothetical protein
MTAQGTMEVGKNSVIYVRLIPGPNKTGEICGKMMVTGTMHRGSTVSDILSVCVCILALVIWHAKCMCHIILSSVARLALPHFSTSSHRWHNFQEKSY